MNNLSWLIYLGGVSENFGGLLVVLGIILAVFCIVAVIFAISTNQDWAKEVREQLYFRVSENESTEAVVAAVTAKVERLAKPVPFWPSIVFGVFAFIFWISAAFTPSKDTVYAIAASEMGERVITSPLGLKAGKAIEAWLDRQITPPPPPSTQ